MDVYRNRTLNNNNNGFSSLRHPKTSSGTSLCPGLSSIYKTGDNPERRGRRKLVHQPGRLFPCVKVTVKNINSQTGWCSKIKSKVQVNGARADPFAVEIGLNLAQFRLTDDARPIKVVLGKHCNEFRLSVSTPANTNCDIRMCEAMPANTNCDIRMCPSTPANTNCDIRMCVSMLQTQTVTPECAHPRL